MTDTLNQAFTSRTQRHVLLCEAPGATWPRLTAKLGEPVGVLTGDGRVSAALTRLEVPWVSQVEVADLMAHPRLERRCLVPVVHRHFSVQFLAGVLGREGLDLVTRGGEPVPLRDVTGLWANWGTPQEAWRLLEPRRTGVVLHRSLL